MRLDLAWTRLDLAWMRVGFDVGDLFLALPHRKRTNAHTRERLLNLRVDEEVRLMNVSDFNKWLRDSNPGDSCIYFEGFLGTNRNERSHSVGRIALEAAGYEYKHVKGLSNGVHLWQLVHEPLINLVQKRIEDDQYSYIAQKRDVAK